VCKRRTWELARDIMRLLDMESSSSGESSLSHVGEDGTKKPRETYDDMKQGQLLRDRMTAKDNARKTLKGWVRNEGDEVFTLDE
jgi:hypothetical protein